MAKKIRENFFKAVKVELLWDVCVNKELLFSRISSRVTASEKVKEFERNYGCELGIPHPVQLKNEVKRIYTHKPLY